MRISLLTNATATSAGQTWPGGRGQFAVAGTFGGAAVTLQRLLPDGTSWASIGADAAVTAAGVANFDLPPCQIRALVTGGSPSGLYAEAVGI